MRSRGHKHTPSNVAESERGLEPSDASCLLPTPTNKERSPQTWENNRRNQRGLSGMAGSVFVSLATFPPSPSSLPLGAEAMCKQQQHFNPKGWCVLRTAGTTGLRLIRHSSTLRRWKMWLKAVLGACLFEFMYYPQKHKSNSHWPEEFVVNKRALMFLNWNTKLWFKNTFCTAANFVCAFRLRTKLLIKAFWMILFRLYSALFTPV